MIRNIIVLSFLTFVRSQSCPDSCECFGEYVTCDKASLVPRGLLPLQASLSLPNHNILTIGRSNFTDYDVSLKHLTIANGTLTSIEDGTFVRMRSLLTLDLHNTRINSVDRNTFIGLDNLTSLDLSKTHLTVLEGRPFSALKSLKILNLAECHNLLKVSGDAFAGLAIVDELFLGSRVMAAFATVSLAELKSVTHLVLEDFPFESLTFLPVPTLERLCIDRWTQLSDVGRFMSATPNLTELSITSADLQQIPVEALQSNKLEILDLSDNPGIKSLRLHDFDKVRNLRELSLSNTGLNTIHEAPFHDNLRLVSLDLSRNHLAVLPVHTLFRLFELERLNISHNNITTLRPNALENARHLKEIDLSSNPIVCDCDLKWLRNWHSFNIKGRQIHGKCDSPRSHRGINIAGMDQGFFVCEPPHFEVHNTTMSLLMNQSSTIDCVPDSGSPDPTVRWTDSQARSLPRFQDLKKYHSDPGMWQLSNGSLYVENMQKNLDGIYRCVAINKEGSSIKTYKLQTKSPLGEQSILLEVGPQPPLANDSDPLNQTELEPIEIPNDRATSTTAIVMIIVGLLLPAGGAVWYIKKRSSYRSILENGEGVKWNSV